MLKKHIEAFIAQLKSENDDRSIRRHDSECSDYEYTVSIAKTNCTLDHIKRLEAILKATEHETE